MIASLRRRELIEQEHHDRHISPQVFCQRSADIRALQLKQHPSCSGLRSVSAEVILPGVVTSEIDVVQDSLRISSASKSDHVQLRKPQVCSAMKETGKGLRSALSSGGHFE